jgi:hypothetical protein
MKVNIMVIKINELLPDKLETKDFKTKCDEATKLLIKTLFAELNFRVTARKPQTLSAYRSIYSELDDWYKRVINKGKLEWLFKEDGFKLLWDKIIGDIPYPKLLSCNLFK